MADEPTGAVAPPVPMPEAQPEARPISVDQAASAISAWRAKQAQPTDDKPVVEQPRVNGRFASADAPESPLEGADAAAEAPSGEEEGAEAAEPPIDAPHSWTKAEKERFASLPRETQAYLAERESARDAELNRRQSEAAEKTKALEAKEQAADHARQQYEQAAQNALQVLQQQQASEFADIKTHADVNKLATDDPFRFAQWQARQMQIAAQAQEVDHLNRQREQEKSNTFKNWSKEQDDKFTKRFPEFADKEKAGKVREGIVSYLTKDIGVPEDRLQKLWETDLFRDAMFQEVVYDASRFRAAQAKAKAAVQAPKPPVQRPGTAPAKGSQLEEQVAAAAARLNTARGNSGLEAAAELMRLRRARR